jgi:hypothetical protein
MQFLDGPDDALDGRGELVVGLEGVEDLFRLCLLRLSEVDEEEKQSTSSGGIPIQRLAL